MYVLPLNGTETRNVVLPNRLPCVLVHSPRATGCVLRLSFPYGAVHDSRHNPGLVSLMAAVYGVERPNGHHPLPGSVELGYEATHIDIAYATAHGAVSELLRRVQAPFPTEPEVADLWYKARDARRRWTDEAKTEVRLGNLLRRHHYTQISTYSLPWPHGNRFELDPDSVDRPSYAAVLLRWLRDYRPSLARVTLLSAEPLDGMAAEVSRLGGWCEVDRATVTRRPSRQSLKPPWRSGAIAETADVRLDGSPAAVVALSFPTEGASSELAKYMDLLERADLGLVRFTTYRMQTSSVVAFSLRVTADPHPGATLPSLAHRTLVDAVRPLLAGDPDVVSGLAQEAFAALARDLGAVHRDPYGYMRTVYPYVWPSPPPVSLVRTGVLRPRSTTANIMRLFRNRDHARVSILRHPDIDFGEHLAARHLSREALGW